MTEISEVLDKLNADVLHAFVRRLDLPFTSTRRPESLAALEHVLTQDVRRVIGHLSKEEELVVVEAAYNDGQVNPHRFTAKYGIKCPLPKDSTYPPSSVSMLVVLIGPKYGPLRLPAPVAKAIRAAFPKPAPPRLLTVDSLPVTFEEPGKSSRPIQVYESEHTVFSELRAVLKLAQSGKLQVSEKSGRPTGQAVRLINEVLVVPDFQLEPPAAERAQYSDSAGGVRAHAWGVLLQQCKWAKAKGGKLALTDAGRKLLNSISMPDFKLGVAEFLSDDRFDEFNRIDHIRGQSGNGRRYLTMPSERRLAIEEALQELPPNRWITIPEAFRYAWAKGHEFAVTRADDTLYFCELQYGMLAGHTFGINRQYLRAVLFESLATLGLVDVAYVYPHHLWPELGDGWGTDVLSFCSRYDGLLYVRLNALGAYCFDVTPSYEPPVQPGGVFRVLPNREIVALGDGAFSPADRHMLGLFASSKSDFVWELDTAKILSHVESGGSLDDVQRFLESNSSAPIPETVHAMLADLARGIEAFVSAEDAILLEFKDAATAALIAHDPQAGKYCHLAGGRRLAVPRKNLRAVRTAMKKLGIIIPDGRLPT